MTVGHPAGRTSARRFGRDGWTRRLDIDDQAGHGHGVSGPREGGRRAASHEPGARPRLSPIRLQACHPYRHRGALAAISAPWPLSKVAGPAFLGSEVAGISPAHPGCHPPPVANQVWVTGLSPTPGRACDGRATSAADPLNPAHGDVQKRPGCPSLPGRTAGHRPGGWTRQLDIPPAGHRHHGGTRRLDIGRWTLDVGHRRPGWTWTWCLWPAGGLVGCVSGRESQVLSAGCPLWACRSVDDGEPGRQVPGGLGQDAASLPG